MENIKDLLLQVLIVLLPIFFYHMFLANRYNGTKSKEKTIVIFLIVAATMIACMSFPIFTHQGQRYDLRFIVLMFGVMYGGYRSGIFLSLVLLVYRFYFGGWGVYSTLFEALLIIPVIFLSYKCFLRSHRTERTKVAVLISIYIASIMMFVHYILKNPFFNIQQFSVLGLIMVVTSCIIVFLIENIRENYKLHLEVQNKEKIKILAELTSSFAHEIRNPIQINRGFLQLLNESSIPEKYKGYVEICIEEIDRVNNIITDYLTFAKPELDKVEPIEVGDEIRKLVNLINSYALMQNIKIHIDLDSNPLWIMANEQKFKQCLINFIKNGIESMHEGGTLRISCTPNKSHVQIRIVDQGIGMTEDQIKRLGTPFYTLKDKGTGLGLMVSYRIAELYNGKISVTSEKGKGTMFTILFPQISF